METRFVVTALVCFFIGLATDHFFFRSKVVENRNTTELAPVYEHNMPTVSSKSGSGAESPPTSQAEGKGAASAGSLNAIPKVSLTLPHGATTGNDQQLYNLIEQEIPLQPPIQEIDNGDGTHTMSGKGPDGGEVARIFNENGTLSAETWEQASGAHVDRMFYDDGGVRYFNYKKADGTATRASFTQSGVFKGRVDELSDGTSNSTEYDDHGEVIDRWHFDKDGEATKLN